MTPAPKAVELVLAAKADDARAFVRKWAAYRDGYASADYPMNANTAMHALEAALTTGAET